MSTLRGIDDSAARAYCRGLEGPHELKTATFNTQTWSSVQQPWPAMAQRDFGRLVGSLGDHSTVALALAWIRRNVIQGRIAVGSEASGEYDEIEDHPLGVMLRRPNPWDSWRATLGGTSDSLKVDGNAYWLKARNGLSEVGEVYWRPNHMIVVEPEADARKAKLTGPVRGYWYSNGGEKTWYEPSEVVHFRDGRDPLCLWMGLSDLKRQLRNAGSIIAAERYTAAVLMNAHSGKLVSPKTTASGGYEPDEKEMEAARRTIEQGASGENAGRIAKTTVAVEVADLGFGPESMMLDRIVDRPESYVLAALGVNALTLGLPSSKDVATYANKGEARREAWENGVIPVQDLIADEIEAQLLPDFADAEIPPQRPKKKSKKKLADAEAMDPKPNRDLDKEHYCVWWDRKDVHALKEDANERATRAVALRGAMIADLNEARGLVDLPEIEGGDTSPIEEAEQAAQQQIDQIEAHAQATAGQRDQQDDGATKTLDGIPEDEGEDDDDPFPP